MTVMTALSSSLPSLPPLQHVISNINHHGNPGANNPGSSDLWLLQHAHRLAIANPNEKAAQTVILNHFWSQLVSFTTLEKSHTELCNVNFKLTTSIAEKDRLIENLRSQLPRANTIDTADTMARLCQILVTLTGQHGDDSSKEQAALTLQNRELDYTKTERLNEMLQKELDNSQQEVIRLKKHLEVVEEQNKTAITRKDERIEDLRASYAGLMKQLYTTTTAHASGVSMKRRKQN